MARRQTVGSIIITLVLTVFVPPVSIAQNGPINLGFEEWERDQTPVEWSWYDFAPPQLRREGCKAARELVGADVDLCDQGVLMQ